VTSAAVPTQSALRSWGFLVGSSAVALLLLVPWAPSFIGTSGDAGFTYMAHHHFARGIPWGTETLHTTGPWAMLRFPLYVRETFPWMLGIHAALALWIVWILDTASRRLGPLAGAALILGCLWLFFISDDARWFFVLLTFPLFVPDLRRQRTSVPLVLGCLWLGLSFHVKGTFLIATVPLVIWLATCELRARRPPWHTLLVFAAVLAFNALAGSELRYIPGYVDFVLGGTAGNPENFSQLGPLYQPIAFLSLAGVFMLVVLRTELRDHGPLGWLSFLVYGAVVWMVYRTGFARQDTVHASRSFFTFVPFVACYAAMKRDSLSEIFSSSKRFTKRQLRIGFGAVCALLAWPFGLFILDYLEIHEDEGKRVWSQMRSMLALTTSGYTRFDAFDEARKGHVRERHPLPASIAPGSKIGVYGQLQTPIVAHGYENAPMPIIAAYENWNPASVERTVAWIESDEAPPTMLMTSTGHSSETLRALSERYRMSHDGWPVVLERRESPLDIRFTALAQPEGEWGDRMRIPIGHERKLMRLKVRYERTLLNRLISFAYQPPPAYIVLWNGPEVVCRIRLNRLLAEEGLILATKDFVNWDTRSGRLQRVRHNLLPDIGRPNRMPLTAYQLQLLPAILTKESLEPGEKPWLIPGSNWRWYFQPEVEFTLETIHVPSREDWTASSALLAPALPSTPAGPAPSNP
jgi:hypothetical protein